MYFRPEMKTEAFYVEDIITDASNSAPEFDDGDTILGGSAIYFDNFAPETDGNAAAPSDPKTAPKLEVFGTVDAVGSFNQEITGGNAIQEGLNNLYENFLSKL